MIGIAVDLSCRVPSLLQSITHRRSRTRERLRALDEGRWHDQSMLSLVEPTVSLQEEWLECHREWGPGVHEDGFGLRPTDRVDDDAGFAAWIGRLQALAIGAVQHAGNLPTTSWWIMHEAPGAAPTVVGGLALRVAPGTEVLRTGHVGYGVRPSARGQGVASWALARAVEKARALGIDPLLLVCVDDNIASIKTIERLGGTLAQRWPHDQNTVLRRYEIATRPTL